MDTRYMRKLKHLHNICTVSKFTYYYNLWMDIIVNVSMVAYQFVTYTFMLTDN